MPKAANNHVTQKQFKHAMDEIKDEVHFLGIKLEDLDSKMDTLLEVCSPLLQKTTNHEERITKLEAIAPFNQTTRR